MPIGDYLPDYRISANLRCHLKSELKVAKVEALVVRVCFFSLSLPTKHNCCDVTMRAVTIWGLERGKERVSECATCE